MTIRQGLLLHEIVHAMNKEQKPIIGDIIKRTELNKYDKDPRGLMKHLRSVTLMLKSEEN